MHQALRVELEITRQAFHALLAALTPEDWDRPSRNPSWTIGELLHSRGRMVQVPGRLARCLPSR
jgi:hypothetical protein